MRWLPDNEGPPPAPAPMDAQRIASGGPDLPDVDERRYVRLGWAVMLLGFCGFLAWAALAPLDKGVPAPGTVKVAGNRKTVQSPAEGLVAAILVRDGERVAAGQPLVRLDETAARTSAQSVRIQLASARATAARLAAERDDAPAIAFPPALLAQAASEPEVRAAIALQRQLLASRRLALANEIAALREAVAGHEGQLRSLGETQASRRQQEASLREQTGNLRALAAEGYATRNRLLDTERLLSQTLGSLAEGDGQAAQLTRQAAEQKLRIVQRREQYQAEVRAQLADVQPQVDALAQRLEAAEHALRHSVVAAPVEGTVVGMAVFTQGGHVRAGEKLMDLVPSKGSLVVEGQVPVHLIDKVRPGLDVELLFPAFNQNTTPRVEGRVRVVGADRLVDERTGLPYYPIEAEVTQRGMQAIAGLDLRPGMPAEVFVRTGERSLLSYLFKPLLDRAHRALTEE